MALRNGVPVTVLSERTSGTGEGNRGLGAYGLRGLEDPPPISFRGQSQDPRPSKVGREVRPSTSTLSGSAA